MKKLKEDIKNLSKSKDKKKKRAKKDKALPKGASSPYIMFTSEQIPLLKAMPKHKAKLESKELKHTDFMGMAAELWGKLSDKEKEKYNTLAEKDKERHEREMTEFKEKGYYTLPNGERSQPAASKDSKADDDSSSSEEEVIVQKKKVKRPEEAKSKTPAKKPLKETKE